VNLPEQPPTFRPPTPAERPWWWRLEDADGGEVEAGEDLSGQRFVSQADAESWVGETWTDLVDVGVAAVTLLEGDRTVYGPMSLAAG
jgi:hypothetical protein